MTHTIDSYLKHFIDELNESQRHLTEARKIFNREGYLGEDYAHAVDAYGDTKKILEELETDFLRGRLSEHKNTTKYENERARMNSQLRGFHSSLLNLLKKSNSQKLAERRSA